MYNKIEYSYSNGLVSTIELFKHQADITPIRVINYEYNTNKQISLMTVSENSIIIRQLRFVYNNDNTVSTVNITPAPINSNLSSSNNN